jgi:hypothetical protein
MLLNLGSGSNPMAGAFNVDINPAPGVDIIADVNQLPFAVGAFSEVHAINPHGFQPVSVETARVMQPGGLLYVTGTMRNRLARLLPPARALLVGFELLQTTPIIPAHQFGIQRTSTGLVLNARLSKTTTYRRLP